MDSDRDVPPRARRRTRGRRQQRRRRRRQRRFLRVLTFTAVLAGVVAGGILLSSRPLSSPTTSEDPTPSATSADGDVQPTAVIATFDEADRTAGASLVFILATRPDADDADAATLLFVPTDTLADIPGHGLDRVGHALAFGGPPLLGATVDNLLGVSLDGVGAISQQGWASLFSRIGGLTVTLDERVVVEDEDGQREVRFEPGEQHLDGPRLAELLTLTGDGEDELDGLSRTQRVLLALLRALREDPDALDRMFAGPSLFEGALDDDSVRDLLARTAAAADRERLETLTLPVSPIGSGDEAALRIDRERADALVGEHFAGSTPAADRSDGRRLQILNGNGRPGIGQDVAQRLVPAGFSVVLTDNADRFDYEQTRIVVYDGTEPQLTAAREVRDLLGVGEVEISRSPQSVVDITVVVGHDFLERIDGQETP